MSWGLCTVDCKILCLCWFMTWWLGIPTAQPGKRIHSTHEITSCLPCSGRDAEITCFQTEQIRQRAVLEVFLPSDLHNTLLKRWVTLSSVVSLNPVHSYFWLLYGACGVQIGMDGCWPFGWHPSRTMLTWNSAGKTASFFQHYVPRATRKPSNLSGMYKRMPVWLHRYWWYNSSTSSDC
jgi:hypothetical protein